MLGFSATLSAGRPAGLSLPITHQSLQAGQVQQSVKAAFQIQIASALAKGVRPAMSRSISAAMASRGSNSLAPPPAPPVYMPLGPANALPALAGQSCNRPSKSSGRGRKKSQK